MFFEQAAEIEAVFHAAEGGDLTDRLGGAFQKLPRLFHPQGGVILLGSHAGEAAEALDEVEFVQPAEGGKRLVGKMTRGIAVNGLQRRGEISG